MKIARVAIENHSRIGDVDVELRDHAVFVGANDVGKTSLLRALNLLLGSSTSQLYQSLSQRDLREIDKPFVVEVDFTDLEPSEWTVFPHEATVEPGTDNRSLKLRMEVEVDPTDPDSITITRWFPDAGTARAPRREQLAALNWRFLPAFRSAAAGQIDGPNSALQSLLNGLDLGDEQRELRELLVGFNDTLRTSAALAGLREKVAGHLSKAMPRSVETDDLLVRTASDPTDSVLRDVSVFFDRDGKQIPITEQSDGIRQLLLMSLFDLAESEAHTIAIDEPELHLHPSSQRTLAELLQNSNNQKLIATHSPYIVQRFDPAEVVAITPDGRCHQIPNEKRGEVERVLAHWWSPRLIEVLTARRVVVVEGLADRIVVEAAARASGIDLDRVGTVVFEIDGADKFPNVYKLIGTSGFCIPTFGLVDEKEKGRWLGAVEGKPKNILGKKIWVSDPDLEGEYCAGLSGPVVARILIEAKLHQEQGILQSCDRTSLDDVTAESIAEMCRGNKVGAAVAVAKSLTRETVASIPSLKYLTAALSGDES